MEKKVSLEHRFVEIIAAEVGCRPQQAAAAVDLFAEGATVPFVARYRKEVTGVSSTSSWRISPSAGSISSSSPGAATPFSPSIAEQGRLTPELERTIRATTSKQELEDLYLPYKPKRRTRAQIAREKGLEPLADALLGGGPRHRSSGRARPPFVDPEKGVEDDAAVSRGARDISAERLAESALLRARLRQVLAGQGCCGSSPPGKETAGAVYRDSRSQVSRFGTSVHRLLAIPPGLAQAARLLLVVLHPFFPGRRRGGRARPEERCRGRRPGARRPAARDPSHGRSAPGCAASACREDRDPRAPACSSWRGSSARARGEPALLGDAGENGVAAPASSRKYSRRLARFSKLLVEETPGHLLTVASDEGTVAPSANRSTAGGACAAASHSAAMISTETVFQ